MHRKKSLFFSEISNKIFFCRFSFIFWHGRDAVDFELCGRLSDLTRMRSKKSFSFISILIYFYFFFFFCEVNVYYFFKKQWISARFRKFAQKQLKPRASLVMMRIIGESKAKTNYHNHLFSEKGI